MWFCLILVFLFNDGMIFMLIIKSRKRLLLCNLCFIKNRGLLFLKFLLRKNSLFIQFLQLN